MIGAELSRVRLGMGGMVHLHAVGRLDGSGLNTAVMRSFNSEDIFGGKGLKLPFFIRVKISKSLEALKGNHPHTIKYKTTPFQFRKLQTKKKYRPTDQISIPVPKGCPERISGAA